MTDAELLRRYGDNREEAAFTELVRRYVDFVHSAAVRQVGGDAHLAQDVTQSVFIDLARKARALASRPVLSGWLYTSTRYAAAKAVRAEQRRRTREVLTMHDMPQDSTSEPTWEELQPILDDVMHQLNERERNAVLLRYFEGRPFGEVGAKLGLTEDAARMRIGRAIDKLRGLLARRGITSTSAALTALLSTQAVTAAPANMAVHVVGMALASAAGATGTGFTLLNIMATTKLKIAVVSAAVIGLATPLAIQHQSQVKLRQENQSLRRQNEQVAALTAENLRLSNLLAKANGSPVPQSEPSNELLKLRGEVARLREDSRELARLKAAPIGAIDPSIDSTLQTLAARATRLKRHLEQVPDKRIPELQLITEKEWIDAVAKQSQLETADDFSRALNKLRSIAKSNLGTIMQKALKQYAQANDGMLPTDLAQLQPYFDRPIDDAVLQRYQLAHSGKLADVESQTLIHEIAPPVDAENDTIYKFSLNGTSTESIRTTARALDAAARAYAKANNGLLPRDPSHLAPYLSLPVDAAGIQKYLAKFPPNVTTYDQFQRYSHYGD